jgi:uncharacterized membrane protein YbhN (UPF0104 family)
MPASFVRKHAIALVASALITAGVVWTISRGGLKLVPDGGDFGDVHWWGVALYIPSWFASQWFRCIRWRFLLRAITEVPRRRLFAVGNAGLAVILLLPFRLGELARPYMLRTRPEERRDGEPVLTMTAATSSTVAERVIDGLFVTIILALVLVFVPTLEPLPDKVANLPISVATVRASGFIMLGVFAGAFIVLAVFYFARDWADHLTRVVIGKLSPRLADRLCSLFEKLADGLHVLGRARDAFGFLVETALYWGFNILGMWVLARGCGIAISLPECAGLMGMLACAILIPGPPGLLGLFQAGIYAGMAMYFPTQIVLGPGAAYVFLLYLTQLVLQVLTGAWGLYDEGGARRLRGALGS